ncbi:hypothetical protein A9K55_005277 [Cordyceps militaris]|uniref:Dimeric alpha-beta barrel n=1 Tax=Cordyceps militaris TaxID=73501 RepID=A0A2H4SP74_CORMI|nr:hypothetical protein A9K55_005277 [Cordyceps militaris]
MPISEIGLLRLKPTASLSDPDLQKRLTDVQSHLSAFTGHPFHYFRQVEDPSLLYLLGQWASLESHYQGMHGSDEWKKGVAEMGSCFSFQWMAHYDFLLDRLRPGAVVLEAHRFIMKTEARDPFDEQRAKATAGEAGGAEGYVVGGWKVDAKEGEEEYTVVLAVENADERSPLSERYDHLEQFADRADRHLIRKFI